MCPFWSYTVRISKILGHLHVFLKNFWWYHWIPWWKLVKYREEYKKVWVWLILLILLTIIFGIWLFCENTDNTRMCAAGLRISQNGISNLSMTVYHMNISMRISFKVNLSESRKIREHLSVSVSECEYLYEFKVSSSETVSMSLRAVFKRTYDYE